MRPDFVKRAIIGLIIGIALAVFGYADIEYWLTDLPYEVNVAMEYIGGVITFIAVIYLIYGFIKSPEPAPAYMPPSPSYPPPTASPPPPPTAAPMRPQFCTHCGQPVSPDIKFCGNCGAPIS
jgi:hypothetical protein